MVTAVPWFPIDTLSSRGLGYPHTQQRNIPRRQRTCRFPPDDCRCFPPKIAPSSVGDALGAEDVSSRSWRNPLEKVASRE